MQCTNVDKEDLPLIEEEIEPEFKYERLSENVQAIVQKEAVSCVTFNSKIICIGTFWGLVHVFDHAGKPILIQHKKAHTVAVNHISLDSIGDYIATCSDDGKAYVYGLYTIDHQLQFTSEHSVHCVAIDPQFFKLGANRRFVTGDNRLLLHEKAYFSSRLHTTQLVDSVGPVQYVKWYGRFVTYAYRNCSVRVYDIEERKLVGIIQWEQPQNNKTLDQYPCCLTWKNSVTLLIGWQRTLRICYMERRRSITKESPAFMVNVQVTVQVSYIICGIFPLDVSLVGVLAYNADHDISSDKALPPCLYLLQAKDNKYEEVYADTLSLRSYHLYACGDYHLEYFHNESTTKFIIACPKDIVIAVRYDDDERIDWLVNRSRFEEAMELASSKLECLQRNSLLAVGQKYINHLLTRKEYARAGQICAQVLGDDKMLWENEAFRFARIGQLRAISQYSSADPQRKLDLHIYEMTLYECLKREPKKFMDIIQKWSPQVYNKDDVKNAVHDLVISFSHIERVLPEILDVLLAHSKPYQEVLDFYIIVKYKGVFEYIRENRLKKNLYGKLNELMEVDALQTVNLLVDAAEGFLDVEKVISELQVNRYHLYLYLHTLYTNFKYESRKYHNELVKLYAEFCPAKLLPLLQRSRYYSLPQALSVCEKYNLYKEIVHLLSRMGDTKKALHLLLCNVDDIEVVSQFCEKHNDFELWYELIQRYKNNPKFFQYFLPKMDQYLDPKVLIRAIDNSLPIATLKYSLVNKLNDCRQKARIEESCKNVFISDNNKMFNDCMSMQKKGHRVDDDLICSVCNQRVLIEGNFNSIIMFLCSHTFHETCLSSTGIVKTCYACLASDSKVASQMLQVPT